MNSKKSILMMIAGAKGTVASTVAVAALASRRDPNSVFPFLTTTSRFSGSGIPLELEVAGWDTQEKPLAGCIAENGVLPEKVWKPLLQEIDCIPVKPAPRRSSMKTQIEAVAHDIDEFRNQHPDSQPVFINLLPACANPEECSISELSDSDLNIDPSLFPDLAYAAAAVSSGIPVVNFTPNELETPSIIEEALRRKVPMAGRDGKTGQTYFKTVLASSLKARNLLVDGWYSLNILGNADGMNLMNPLNAAGKLRNKTALLDEILGYPVGEAYGTSSHKVHIDYYPPRGDAKEAWDVIDIKGLFGMPMSIRVNLLGRDSVLAAPLAIDLTRWVVLLQMAGCSGPVPALGFYFKKPVGDHPPITFQEQIDALQSLEARCMESIRGRR